MCEEEETSSYTREYLGSFRFCQISRELDHCKLEASGFSIWDKVNCFAQMVVIGVGLETERVLHVKQWGKHQKTDDTHKLFGVACMQLGLKIKGRINQYVYCEL